MRKKRRRKGINRLEHKNKDWWEIGRRMIFEISWRKEEMFSLSFLENTIWE
jgi:hypothetical protein